MKARLALACLIALPLLASCGLQKPLEKPGPMWGQEKKKYDAEQARLKAEADARAKGTPVQPGGDVAPPPPPDVPAPTVNPMDAPKLP